VLCVNINEEPQAVRYRSYCKPLLSVCSASVDGWQASGVSARTGWTGASHSSPRCAPVAVRFSKAVAQQ